MLNTLLVSKWSGREVLTWKTHMRTFIPTQRVVNTTQKLTSDQGSSMYILTVITFGAVIYEQSFDI